VSEPIVSVDISEIHEGKLEQLKTAMKELVEFVDANEPQPIAYNVYFDEDDARMTVVQLHPDSASMEFHMNVAGSAFPRLAEFLTLSRIDLYGKPSDELLEQMRQKARMLGNAALTVHELHAGFSRLGVR
jgi:quinol monooxygenase YgiN